MKITELNPDKVLAEWMDNRLFVQTSISSPKRGVRVYAQGEQPQTGLDDEFMTVSYNGVIQSKTYPMGVMYGNLALSINSKAVSGVIARRKRLALLAEQSAGHIDRRVIGGYYYEIDLLNPIVQPTVNLTSGYATMVLNISWHTTDEIHNHKSRTI